MQRLPQNLHLPSSSVSIHHKTRSQGKLQLPATSREVTGGQFLPRFSSDIDNVVVREEEEFGVDDLGRLGGIFSLGGVGRCVWVFERDADVFAAARGGAAFFQLSI